MALDFATLASASHLSKEDRRAYLKAMERENERPMAAPGLTSYRYRGRYGFVMIGARDKADALNEARRSIDGPANPDNLEIWSANARRYVKA